jgi:hypothetical protein
MKHPRPDRQERAGKSQVKPCESAEAPGRPADFRAGLLFFALLEVVAWVFLSRVSEPWGGQPAFSPWRNGFLAATTLVVLGVAFLWRAGGRSSWHGLILAIAIFWLLIVAARLVPLWVIGESSVPAFLALFSLQLAFGLMVIAAAGDIRKAVAQKRDRS